MISATFSQGIQGLSWSLSSYCFYFSSITSSPNINLLVTWDYYCYYLYITLSICSIHCFLCLLISFLSFFFLNWVILFFQSPAQCSHWVHLHLFPSLSCIIRTSWIILKFIRIVHINCIVVKCTSVLLSIGCTSWKQRPSVSLQS